MSQTVNWYWPSNSKAFNKAVEKHHPDVGCEFAEFVLGHKIKCVNGCPFTTCIKGDRRLTPTNNLWKKRVKLIPEVAARINL